MKTWSLRLLRKTAFLIHFVTLRVSRFSKRVENKITKLISESDLDYFAGRPVVEISDYISDYLPQITLIRPALPIIGRKPAVSLLIPTVDKELFFGGVATAIISAAYLAIAKNMDLRVIQTFKPGEADIEQFIKTQGIDFLNGIELIDITDKDNDQQRTIDIHPEDIFMASAWPDAYLLERLPLIQKFVYLIQDYEPIFFSNSDEKALSMSTYENDSFIALCNTELMYEHMLQQGHQNISKGTWFEPAVSYSLKRKSNPTGKRLMFIYGRPRVKRNLFINAIKSVDMFFDSDETKPEEWEVVFAGQEDVPNIKLQNGITITNLGKLDIKEYKELLSRVDVGVSLMMAPHPNYPTLELATSGAAVVTTKYENKTELSRYSDNIIVTDISPESISAGIREAALLSDEIKIDNTKKTKVSTSWEKSLEDPIKFLSKKFQ